MELGNLSEITGALTAVAAFIAAVAAARYAKGQLESSNEQLLEVQKQVQIEIERDKKSEERERRQHASQISAWIESIDWGTRVVIQNNSNVPVYDLIANVNCRSYNFQTRKAEFSPSILNVQVLPPGKFVWIQVANEKEALPSEKKAGWSTARYYEECDHGTPVLNSPKWKVNSLKFRDAMNRSWIRDEKGLFPQGESD